MPSADEVPTYKDLIYPTIVAVEGLGGSAQGGQITDRVVADLGLSDEIVAMTYPSRPKSILVDRAEWARSYAKLGGALESPKRGLFVITTLGREIAAASEDEALKLVGDLDRRVKARRAERGVRGAPSTAGVDEEVERDVEITEGGGAWTDALLDRLHRLDPTGFEEFAMVLLRSYGLQLTRVGGTGDEGIDGIGTAPLSPVLSSRVAVQAKRYDPGSAIGRDVVALFQRDASAAGAERAVLVTLGRFTEAARKAATAATPTVDLIDGERLCALVLDQQLGVRSEPKVDEAWFDRFDKK